MHVGPYIQIYIFGDTETETERMHTLIAKHTPPFATAANVHNEIYGVYRFK